MMQKEKSRESKSESKKINVVQPSGQGLQWKA